MSLLAILGVVYGLKQLAQDGVSAAPVLVIVLGLLIGYVFVRRQLRLESPMIDVRLFRIRAFSASLGTYFFGIFVVVGYFLFISQYLQLILGLSPLEAAVWSLPSAVGFIVGSTIAPRIIHRFRPSVIMGVGMAIAAAGTAMLLGLSVDGDGSLVLIAVASVIISLGLAPVITLATELIVGSAPPEQAGAATGISETSGELGGALGIAILGSLGTAVYRANVADSLPSDMPAEAAERGAGHARWSAGDRGIASRRPRRCRRRGRAAGVRRRPPRRRGRGRDRRCADGDRRGGCPVERARPVGASSGRGLSRGPRCGGLICRRGWRLGAHVLRAA